MRSLLPWQHKPLAYTQRIQHPFLAMEMRLGKTFVMIRAVQAWKSKRVLVISPLSVVDVWADELREENESMDRWELIHFEGLLAMFKRMEPGAFDEWQRQFDVVIIDESTRIKNPQAQITKLCCAAFRQAKHRVCLSGLPDPEGPEDFFMQMKFLHDMFMGETNFYQWRFKNFKLAWYTWQPRPGVREQIREMVHSLAFVLTRKQAGVGGRKIYERRFVDPTPEQRKMMKQVAQDFAMGRMETKYVPVVHSWLRRIAGGHGPDWSSLGSGKIKELVRLLKGDLKSQQVVVFFAFNHELAKVWQALKKEGISTVWITGKTKRVHRRERREKFMQGRARVALLQVGCVKYGLNFAAASTAIYYSNSESLETRMQSEDRIVHPTKQASMLYIDLVTKGSVDEDVSKLLLMKRVNAKYFLHRLRLRVKERLHAAASKH